jgi:large subunit ribosomal protein L10
MKKVGQLYRESLVEQIRSEVTKSDHMFLLSYSCVSGGKMNDLRKNLSRAGAHVSVMKNSIARFALKELDYAGLAEQVSDQTAFVWGGADSAEVSKILINFVKDADNIVVQGGLLQGGILEKGDVKRLSDLPSREILLTMLLGAIQSPLTRLAGALNAKTRELLSILKQLSEKKGGN